MDTGLKKRQTGSSSKSKVFNSDDRNAKDRSQVNNLGKKTEKWNKPKNYTNSQENEAIICNFLNELEKKISLKLPKYSIDELAETLKNSFSNKIFCSISELHQAFFSIYDIIHNYENFGIDQTNFFIGRYEFILNINDNDLPLPAKDQIEKYFRDFTKTKDTETVLFKDFPESIKNLFNIS